MKKIKLILGFVFVLSFVLIFPPFYAPYAFSSNTPDSLIRKELVKQGVIYQSFVANIDKVGKAKFGTKYNVSVYDIHDKSIVTVPFEVDKDSSSGKYYITAVDNIPKYFQSFSKAVTSEEEKKEEIKKDELKEPSVGIGQPIKVGDLVFTISGKSYTSNVGEFGQPALGRYIIFDISVKNEGQNPIKLHRSFFNLKSSDITYYLDTLATTYANDSGAEFFVKNLNPGMDSKGKIVFDIPVKVTPLQLQVQTFSWDPETGVINLQ
jgi:hypothetical protein